MSADGSGELGQGGISWDSNGTFNISHIGLLEATHTDSNNNIITTRLQSGEFRIWKSYHDEIVDRVSVVPGTISLSDDESTATLQHGKVYIRDPYGATTITGSTISAHEINASSDVTIGGDLDVTGDISSHGEPLYTESQVRSMVAQAINFVLAQIHTENGSCPQIIYREVGDAMYNQGWNLVFRMSGTAPELNG